MKQFLPSLLLLLHCTAVTVSQNCTQEGDVEIIGTVTPTLIAGRMEICVGGRWHAVYDESYGFDEAQIVCQKKGLNNTGICRQSCFGASNLTRGFTDFTSCRGATSLIECGEIAPNGLFPDINAGVICFKGDMLNFPPPDNSTGTTASPPLPTTDFTSFTSEPRDISAPFFTLPKTSIALVVVSAILLLALVGVVMGWAWSCYRNRNQDSLLQKTLQVTSTAQDASLKSSHVKWTPTDTSNPSCSALQMQANPCYDEIVNNTTYTQSAEYI